MVVKGTYFQNDKDHPLVYGDINLINPPRRRLRGEEEKGRNLINDICTWLWSIEDTVQERLDLDVSISHVPIWYDRLIKIKADEEANITSSDIVGGAGDEGVQG